ncbi:MAG: SIS domain-containing protein, partial [Longimicrobiales bacterium]
LRDIRSQADSLARVLVHHLGGGRAELGAAADALRRTTRVVITGMGASMYASVPFEYRLGSLGIDATLIESGELLHYTRRLDRDTVVVIVSRSGESVEVVRLLEQLERRCPTIGVTNDPESALARGADHVIHVGSLADETVAIQTYTGTLLTLELLAAAVADDLSSVAGEARAAVDPLRSFIEAGVERLARWDAFFESRSSVHLLARGPSIASALEGALLLNETAKIPAVGVAAASFRHGPVEVVDESFAGLVFAPPTDPGRLNVALAVDLAAFGGRIVVIGPGRPELERIECYETPAVPERMLPLFEVVPLQLAALRLAQSRGLTPGRFRYTPLVSRDEATFAASAACA